MNTVLCNYCLNPAKLVTGADIYPHRPDLYSKQFWECKPCDAHIAAANPAVVLELIRRLRAA